MSHLHFVDYVDSCSKSGYNGHGQKAEYISFDRLDAYWTSRRIQDMCDSHRITCSQTAIQLTCLRLFSTLVYAGKAASIATLITHGMIDDKFPTDQPPSGWPRYQPFADVFGAIVEYQWRFFPLAIPFENPHGRVLSLPHIVPITQKIPITDGHARNEVHKICIDPGCSRLDNKPEFYVLKSYNMDSLAEYDAEVHTLTALTNNITQHSEPSILRWYGSYKHGDTWHVILEHMINGSLGDLLKTPPPDCTSDIINLWESLLGPVSGLLHMHANDDNFSNGAMMVHRDIKPDNILLSRSSEGVADGSGQHRYRFRAVLADFGHTILQNLSTTDNCVSRSATGGDSRYRAPENCLPSLEFSRIPTDVSVQSDVFSLGAVFSDIAVWIAFGPPGVKSYLEARKEEHQSMPDYKDSGFEGCYHAGSKSLPSVDAWMEEVYANRSHNQDAITRDMVGLIQNKMLHSKLEHRPNARQVRDDMMSFIRRAQAHPQQPLQSPVSPAGSGWPPARWSRQESQQVESTELHPSRQNVHPPDLGNEHDPVEASKTALNGTSPLSPLLTSHPDQNEHKTSSSKGPLVTLKQILHYRDWCKNPLFRAVDEQAKAVILQLQKNLNRRDHIFLIDDTPSMYRHRQQVIDAFSGLAYIAKSMDDDGLELSFMSSAHKTETRKHTRPLVEVLTRHQYSQDAGTMEDSLNTFINYQVIPRFRVGLIPKPLSVYVFTNGAWGTKGREGSTANGVERPIRRLVERLQQRGLNRTHVMFQFIQFGHDAMGEKFLKYLDNFGQSEKGGEWDIVDTRHISGNVYAMFIGSISEGVDCADDDQNLEEDTTDVHQNDHRAGPSASALPLRILSRAGSKYIRGQRN